MKTISVIVPVYKVEAYIHECIQSIQNQSFKDFELILVDDGSPDKCGEICDNYAKDNDNIKVIHKENGGLVSAWKTGLNLSTAPYIVFIDSDDWIEPNFLELLYKKMEENDASIVSSAINRVYEDKTKKVIGFDKEYIFEKSEIANSLYPKFVSFWSQDEIKYYPNRVARLYKRELFIANEKYCDMHVNMAEDYLITAAVLLDSSKVVCVPDAMYNYRARHDSMVNTFYPNLKRNYEIVFDCLNKIVREKNISSCVYNPFRVYSMISIIINEGKKPSSISSKAKAIKESIKMIDSKIIRKFTTKGLGKTSKICYWLMRYKMYLLLSFLLNFRYNKR